LLLIEVGIAEEWYREVYHIRIDQKLVDSLAQLALDDIGHDGPVDGFVAHLGLGGYPEAWRPTEANPHPIGGWRWYIQGSTGHQTLEIYA